MWEEKNSLLACFAIRRIREQEIGKVQTLAVLEH
jgi:N-acetylglutamate synthase-like GNAT family acetyltransferase